MAFRFDLPEIEDSSALADWIEIWMFRSSKSQISRAELAEAISGMVGSTPQGIETPINFLFLEIGRRRRIAGQAYPLKIDESFIKFDITANSEFYKFLLLISIDGPMRARRGGYKEVDEIFDKIVCAALKKYFGDGTDGLRFGWPVSDGRPKKFNEALEWLSEKIRVPVGSGIPPKNAKDGGVDIVVWKPFADPKSAFLVALAQCTMQSEWFGKARDIIVNVWNSRLDNAGVLTILAIPFTIPADYEKWDELRRTVNIVFDRFRLAQMLGNCDVSPFNEMAHWNKKEISRFALQ